MSCAVSLPAVVSATLAVLPAARAQRLHAVPAPQQRALGPLQQTVPVLREGQRSGLQRGRNTRTVSCGDADRVWTQLCELSLPEGHRAVTGAARPGRSFPEESSWWFRSGESEAETFLLGSSIKAFEWAGRSQHAGSTLIYTRFCHKQLLLISNEIHTLISTAGVIGYRPKYTLTLQLRTTPRRRCLTVNWHARRWRACIRISSFNRQSFSPANEKNRLKCVAAPNKRDLPTPLRTFKAE